MRLKVDTEMLSDKNIYALYKLFDRCCLDYYNSDSCTEKCTECNQYVQCHLVERISYDLMNECYSRNIIKRHNTRREVD